MGKDLYISVMSKFQSGERAKDFIITQAVQNMTHRAKVKYFQCVWNLWISIFENFINECCKWCAHCGTDKYIGIDEDWTCGESKLECDRLVGREFTLSNASVSSSFSIYILSFLTANMDASFLHYNPIFYHHKTNTSYIKKKLLKKYRSTKLVHLQNIL